MPYSLKSTPTLQQVIGRRKPFGTTWSRDDDHHIQRQAESAGLRLNMISEPDTRFAEPRFMYEFCVPGRLIDLFDLDALALDYERELPGLMTSGDLYYHARSEMTRYFDDQWDSPPQPLWLTGLILGYPLENTIALYRARE